MFGSRSSMFTVYLQTKDRMVSRNDMMNRTSYLSAIALALVACTPCLGEGGNTTDSAQSGSSAPLPSSDTEKTVPPSMPKIGLTPVSGFENDSAFVKSASDRAAALVGSAEREDVPLQRAKQLLAAANVILAYQIEPACSRRLLRLSDEDSAVQGGDLVAAFDRADALIDRAGALLTEAEDRAPETAKTGDAEGDDISETDAEAEADDDPKRVVANESQELSRRLKTLEAFSAGLRAYLLSGDDRESSGGGRRAASLLSPLLEDEDRSVAAAATLWQACLRGDDADIPRALSSLDLALRRPAEEALPYAFFSRLERCRLIAKQGGRAVALALLMQIEDRCEEWLEEDTQAEQAARTAQFVQIQVLADWYERALSDSNKNDTGNDPTPVSDDERKWCVDRIDTMKSDRFKEETTNLFRLSAAIPIITEAAVPSPEEATEGDGQD